MDTNATTLNLFRELGIKIELDSELARGYFLICLIKSSVLGAADSLSYRQMKTQMQSEKFKKYLMQFRIESFCDASNLTENMCITINTLCEIFKTYEYYHDMKKFFLGFAPWVIIDWTQYLGNFKGPKMAAKSAALVFILNAESNNPKRKSADVFMENHQFIVNTLGLSQTEFESCWNAVFCKIDVSNIPVIQNKTIKTTYDLYRKYYIPNYKLYSDFCDVIVHKSALEGALNPWLYVNKGMKKMPVERGMTTSEAVFDFGALLLQDQLPTDVIRAVSYPKKRNDSGVECKFLVHDFGIWTKDSEHKLIVNPSPDMVCAMSLAELITYAVPDSTIATLYSKQFPSMKFITFEEIVAKCDSNLDAILFVARDLQAEKITSIVKDCLQRCKQNARLSLLVPNAIFDTSRNKIQTIFHENNVEVQQLLLLPSCVTASIPRKKVLVHCIKKDDSYKQRSVIFSTAVATNETTMLINKQHWIIPYEEFEASNRTLTTMRIIEEQRQSSGKKTEKREPALAYSFSKEITIWYLILAKHKNRFAGKAYYCETLSDGIRRKRGKKITETIEKGLRAESEAQVRKSIESVPFDQRIEGKICEDILDTYATQLQTLSLKTLWFVHRTELKRNPKYQDDCAKHMFCTEHQELADLYPQSAMELDYQEAMEYVLEDTDGVGIKYWEQLSIILQFLVTKKLLMTNPIGLYVQSLSKRATEEQLEVRNALVKKSFTIQEERKILEYICAITSQKRIRYVEESIYLSGALRLFTGMTIREICALTWEDIKQIPGMNTYQIWISKFAMDQDLKPGFQLDYKKFRRIPVCEQLATMLLNRKAYLIEQGRYDKHNPVVLKDEKNDKSFCGTEKVRRYCKEIISQIDIPNRILTLPDIDGNDKETDLTQYYGDIFRSNFRYRANHTCCMTKGENCYILGVAAPDTYSKHYCDYTNDFVQYAMAKKIMRWTNVYQDLICCKSGIMTDLRQEDDYGDVFQASGDEVSAVDLDLEVKIKKEKADKITLMVNCKHGYTGDIVIKWEKK